MQMARLNGAFTMYAHPGIRTRRDLHRFWKSWQRAWWNEWQASAWWISSSWSWSYAGPINARRSEQNHVYASRAYAYRTGAGRGASSSGKYATRLHGDATGAAQSFIPAAQYGSGRLLSVPISRVSATSRIAIFCALSTSAHNRP